MERDALSFTACAAACGRSLQPQCIRWSSPQPISTGHESLPRCLLPNLAGRGRPYLTREENGGKESQTASVDRGTPTVLSLVSTHLSPQCIAVCDLEDVEALCDS